MITDSEKLRCAKREVKYARSDRGAPSEVAYPLTAEAGRTGKGDSAQLVMAVADPICANEQKTWTHEGEHNFRLRNLVPTAFAENQRSELREVDAAGAVSAICRGDARNETLLAERWAVRRLTVRECERLQGFPDDYTLVPYRGALAKDGPRYRALGNSMAVNVMRWIGTRIAIVEKII